MKANFSFIDLFSGIGGFHLGLSPLGGKCLMASDILPIACETYFANFGIQPLGDITKISLKDIPKHDLLCGGFPCQAFSNVGHKKGFEDPRGEMIFEVFRILKGKKPKAFILENVKGLATHNQGKTLTFIIESLQNLGYTVKNQVLEAKDYGLPQIRKRLFIVGVRNDIKIDFEFPKPITLKYTLSEVLGGVVEREFGFTVRIGGRRSGINNRYNWDSYKVNGEVRYITPEECMLLQGFEKNFKLKGTESQKYYQVGNTVPTTIIHEIGKELIKRGIL
jgi:DNA (cytosine-5)-methyltransferase 1